MNRSYRKLGSIDTRGFKKNNTNSINFPHDINQKLSELGVESDILVKSAANVGGISNNPILRIYSKMDDEEVIRKMQKLVEDDLFEKTVERLKHFYI